MKKVFLFPQNHYLKTNRVYKKMQNEPAIFQLEENPAEYFRTQVKQETRSDLQNLGSSINPEIFRLAGGVLGGLLARRSSGGEHFGDFPNQGFYRGRNSNRGYFRQDPRNLHGNLNHDSTRYSGVVRRRDGSIDSGRSGFPNPLTDPRSRISPYYGERYGDGRRGHWQDYYSERDTRRDSGRGRVLRGLEGLLGIFGKSGINLPPEVGQILGGLNEMRRGQRRGGGLPDLGQILGNLGSENSDRPFSSASSSRRPESRDRERSAVAQRAGTPENPRAAELARLREQAETAKTKIIEYQTKKLVETWPHNSDLAQKIKTKVPEFWNNFFEKNIFSHLGKSELPRLDIDRDIRTPLA